ncbi:MAG TPA: DUF1854 domain-containing protein, partial [Abditibacteriaceae bacterium]|nr:DUF1854 domain-containing protein [Abditibacteriaceae bacterium]
PMTMDFNYLDPTATVFETAPDGTLRVMVPDDRCGLRVDALRAFPLSHPEEYIVLRDGTGVEVGLLRNLKDLPPAAATLVRDQLQRRYFLPQVTGIYDISERFGSSVWDLQTDRGRCSVTTRQMNESVFEIDPGRYLITDVEGNRYEVKDLNALDEMSRARFLGKY